MEKERIGAVRIIHTVGVVILLVLVSCIFVLTMCLTYSRYEFYLSGEEPSAGYIAAVLFELIAIFANCLFSAIGIGVSAFMWRYNLGGFRIFGIVSTVIQSSYMFLGILFPFLVFVM